MRDEVAQMIEVDGTEDTLLELRSQWEVAEMKDNTELMQQIEGDMAAVKEMTC